MTRGEYGPCIDGRHTNGPIYSFALFTYLVLHFLYTFRPTSMYTAHPTQRRGSPPYVRTTKPHVSVLMAICWKRTPICTYPKIMRPWLHCQCIVRCHRCSSSLTLTELHPELCFCRSLVYYYYWSVCSSAWISIRQQREIEVRGAEFALTTICCTERESL